MAALPLVLVEPGVTGLTDAVLVSALDTGITGDSGEVCDLYIGSTGTGKSTYCRARAIERDRVKFKPGHTTAVGTLETLIGLSEDGNKICDTRGFDDKYQPNGEVSAEIIRALNKEGVRKIRVIWCVRSIEREAAGMRNQAEFIHSLIPKGANKSAFWRDSVALVMTGRSSKRWKRGTADDVGQIALALEFGGSLGIRNRQNIQLFDELDEDDRDLYGEKDTQVRKTQYGIINRSDLRSFQEETVLLGLQPFDAIKLDERCVKCGITGDHRGWKPGCHAKFKWAHWDEFKAIEKRIERLETIQRKTSQAIGTAMGAVSGIGPGTMVAGTAILAGSAATAGPVIVGAAAGGIIAGGLGFGATKATEKIYEEFRVKRSERWKCCGQKTKDAPGCRLKCIMCEEWRGSGGWSKKCDDEHMICVCGSVSSRNCKCKVLNIVEE